MEANIFSGNSILEWFLKLVVFLLISFLSLVVVAAVIKLVGFIV